jgi:hypothetical protein
VENLIANLTGKFVRRQLHGRDFLVGPAVAIVPGVLNGSKGSLYYPGHEIAKSVPKWNGMPITNGHPVDETGQAVSARHPDVLEKYEIGRVFQANYDGRLTAEAWLDEQLTRNKAPQILKAIHLNQPVELSTGLGTEDNPAPSGSVHNGKTGPKPYDRVATNYDPDHLAILVSHKGACSIKDGCGLGINTAADNTDPDHEPACNCGGECDEYKHKNNEAHEDVLFTENAWTAAAWEASAASRRANAATKVAHETGSKSEHQHAADKHAEAAEKHGKIYGKTLQQGSQIKQQYHQERSHYHELQASLAQNEEGQSLLMQMWVGALNAFGIKQSKVTGRIKKPNAGTGAGDVHEAAQWGNLAITEQDERLGQSIPEELAAGRDMPAWAVDGALWEKAKTAAEKANHPEDWAYVAGIYTRMGGEIGSAQNAETPMNDECITVNGVCVNCGGDGGTKGPCPGSGHGDVPHPVPKKAKQAADASDKADKATAAAAEAKTFEAHQVAVQAHIEAMQQHTALFHNNKVQGATAEHHGEQARKHGDAIRDHVKAGNDIKFKKNSHGELDMALTADQRKTIVTNLATNCDCWKGDEKTLNTLPDDKLVKLNKNYEDGTAAAIVVNAVRAGLKAPNIALNAMPAALQKAMEDKADGGVDDDEEDDTGKKKAAQNQAIEPITKRLTPDELRVWNHAAGVEKREREGLVARLVANVNDPALKARLTANHMKKDLDTLRDEVDATPTVNTRPDDLRLPDYSGAGGGPPVIPVLNELNDPNDAPLDLPVMNWTAKA